MSTATIARTWRVEALRSRSDLLTPGFVVLALLLAPAVRYGTGGGVAAGLVQAVALPLFGSTIRHGLDLRSGAFTRAVLAGHRAAAFAAATASAAVSGAVVAAAGGAAVLVLDGGTTGRAVSTVAVCALCGTVNALLGTCVAVVVRHRIAAPTVALGLYTASLLLVESAPESGATTPVGATAALLPVGLPDAVPGPTALALLALWGLLGVLVGWAVVSRRDVREG